jgi:serine protease
LNNKRLLLFAVTTALQVLPSGFAHGADQDYSSGRLIVVYKEHTAAHRRHTQSLAVSAGAERIKTSATGAHIIDLPQGSSARETKGVADQLRASPEVASVEPDVIVAPMLAPSNAASLAGPTYNQANFPNALNFSHARQLLAGKSTAPVGVVDTGITVHTALPPGQILPGYNFYSLNGSARSPDYYDSGNWVSQADISSNPTCGDLSVADSNWHGTAMAGLIAAVHDGHYHVEGVASGIPLLPARAMGKCGGYLSDVLDAALWSAGISVPGVADNQNPVRIINLSLGVSASCGSYYQNAIDQLLAMGVVVVAAGGNSGEDTTRVIPAACHGVLAIAATDRNGVLASYSGSGSNVTVAAPGGEPTLGIMTTSNTGLTTPVGENSAGYYGTSNATAIVSGIVSLMLTANPALQPGGVVTILMATADSMPACADHCGGGRANADAAVKAALEGVTYNALSWTDTDVGEGASSLLSVKNVSGLAVSFGQSVISGTNAGDFNRIADTCSGGTLAGGETCIVNVRFSPSATGARRAGLQVSTNMPNGISVSLSATGNAAAQETATPPATTTAPSSVSSGGGGGGGGGGGCTMTSTSGRSDLSLLALVMAAALGMRFRASTSRQPVIIPSRHPDHTRTP